MDLQREETARERYAIIRPLLQDSLDEDERIAQRKEISKRENVSVRTLYRWEKAYRSDPKNGLLPLPRGHGMGTTLPVNFDDLLQDAMSMKREVPTRSVRNIIRTLELEHKVEANVLKRSTMQRYFQRAGCTRRALLMDPVPAATAARRFNKEHRMMLVQCDIKYSYRIPATKTTPARTFYLSNILDDHSRFPLHSCWYENQKATVVEESFRQAIQLYGRFDVAYCDNGGQYVTEHLKNALSELGMVIRHAKPRAGNAKGKVEKFHQVVDTFLTECQLAKITDVKEMNKRWDTFKKAYYVDVPHSGIAEYYKVNGLDFPKEGRSPLQEFEIDSRPLEYLNSAMVERAFRYVEVRKVTKGSIVSVNNVKFGVPPEYRGLNVTLVYNPIDLSSVIMVGKDKQDIQLKPVGIGPYVNNWSKPKPQPDTKPNHSRILNAADSYAQEIADVCADAISFADYGMDDTEKGTAQNKDASQE